jgi:hypothetical protein
MTGQAFALPRRGAGHKLSDGACPPTAKRD